MFRLLQVYFRLIYRQLVKSTMWISFLSELFAANTCDFITFMCQLLHLMIALNFFFGKLTISL